MNYRCIPVNTRTRTVQYAGWDWGNQIWAWKKTWIKRGRGDFSFLSLPETDLDQVTRPLIKFQSFRMVIGHRCCSRMFVMILDFKEMTCLWMSLDRCVSCMAPRRTTFTLRVGHLAPWHWDATSMWTFLTFFWDIFGVEMWDIDGYRAGSLAAGLFSHCWIHFCRSKVRNAMASGRNMCRPVCSPDGGGPYSGVKQLNIMKHLERR